MHSPRQLGTIFVNLKEALNTDGKFKWLCRGCKRSFFLTLLR
jgi:hypothetical protein